MKIAFATKEENKFTETHFGDANYYEIYEIFQSQEKFITRIKNTTEEDNEEIHADPKKAKSVMKLFEKEDVKVVVSVVFGPNIKRIKKKFVCILINDKTVLESIKTLQKEYQLITNEWEKGEEREHLNFKRVK